MPTNYTKHGVKLSAYQKARIRNGHAVRLTHSALEGPDMVYLTKSQMSKLQRAEKAGKGAQISLSADQIEYGKINGSGIFSTAKSVAKRVGNFALPVVKSVGRKLGEIALSRLEKKAVSKGEELLDRGLSRFGAGVRRGRSKVIPFGNPNEIHQAEMVHGKGFFKDLFNKVIKPIGTKIVVPLAKKVGPKLVDVAVNRGISALTGGSKRRGRKVAGQGLYAPGHR